MVYKSYKFKVMIRTFRGDPFTTVMKMKFIPFIDRVRAIEFLSIRLNMLKTKTRNMNSFTKR